MKNSPYNLIHVFVALLCLSTMVFGQGLKAFWQQFVHGLPQNLTPERLFSMLMMQSGYFAAMLLILWGSTFIPRLLRSPSAPVRVEPPPPVDRRHGVVLALRLAVPVILVAIALNLLGTKTIEWLTGVQPSEQELVKCFLDPAYSLGMRAFLVFSVVVLAPVCEELIFRGIIFRGLAKKFPLFAAMLVSGFVFALVHINAASFVAVWFLGVTFAWLYARTRTILAPMSMHAAFNLANVVLLIFFPELAG